MRDGIPCRKEQKKKVFNPQSNRREWKGRRRRPEASCGRSSSQIWARAGRGQPWFVKFAAVGRSRERERLLLCNLLFNLSPAPTPAPFVAAPPARLAAPWKSAGTAVRFSGRGRRSRSKNCLPVPDPSPRSTRNGCECALRDLSASYPRPVAAGEAADDASRVEPDGIRPPPRAL